MTHAEASKQDTSGLLLSEVGLSPFVLCILQACNPTNLIPWTLRHPLSKPQARRHPPKASMGCWAPAKNEAMTPPATNGNSGLVSARSLQGGGMGHGAKHEGQGNKAGAEKEWVVRISGHESHFATQTHTAVRTCCTALPSTEVCPHNLLPTC